MVQTQTSNGHAKTVRPSSRPANRYPARARGNPLSETEVSDIKKHLSNGKPVNWIVTEMRSAGSTVTYKTVARYAARNIVAGTVASSKPAATQRTVTTTPSDVQDLFERWYKLTDRVNRVGDKVIALIEAEVGASGADMFLSWLQERTRRRGVK